MSLVTDSTMEDYIQKKAVSIYHDIAICWQFLLRREDAMQKHLETSCRKIFKRVNRVLALIERPACSLHATVCRDYTLTICDKFMIVKYFARTAHTLSRLVAFAISNQTALHLSIFAELQDIVRYVEFCLVSINIWWQLQYVFLSNGDIGVNTTE